jgi:type III pantothenate kinase
MILCDIGNTTYHFKTKNSNFKIGIKEPLTKIKKFKTPIYFLSVNKKATKKLLKNFPKAIDISKFIHFETTYQGMGVDRQIVCKYIKDGIIVDVGSAITVDIMKNGEHLGGFILPGIGAYKRIYPNISKKLAFKFDTDINLDKIPLITNDAINYSILNSIIAPIKNIYKKYKTPIYFTGEDSKLLLSYFEHIPHKYKKNLIFNSMKKVILKNIKGK